MTTTATLTERYISATIRSLTPEVQNDVRAELEASIADAIDAKLEQGRAPQPRSAPSSPSSATRASSRRAMPTARCT